MGGWCSYAGVCCAVLYRLLLSTVSRAVSLCTRAANQARQPSQSSPPRTRRVQVASNGRVLLQFNQLQARQSQQSSTTTTTTTTITTLRAVRTDVIRTPGVFIK